MAGSAARGAGSGRCDPQPCGRNVEWGATLNCAVWITGIGAWNALGRNAGEFWEALAAGKSGVGDLVRFAPGDMRCPRVAACPDPGGPFPNRADNLALVAAREALVGAGLTSLPDGAGIALGAGVGGLPESEEAYIAFLETGRLSDHLRDFTGHLPATTADVLGREFGGGGPRISVANACTSSTVAIGLGGLWVEEGECDLVLAGASDALSRLTVGGFNCLRVVSADRPKPFDKNRNGMVIGEGAAFLVLESSRHAVARGARPLAVLEGVGLSADAHHATAPQPDGEGALAAMRQALAAAGAGPETVDHVNAHGTATPSNDLAEGKALAALLGERTPRVPVTSIKGAVGHCLGAAGAMEAVAAVLALVHQTVPPCAGFAETDPAIPLWVPREAVAMPLQRVLSVNLAFGGNNAALSLGRAP
jgi:3-oxoacyl-[acyl-carrier-protein] synthase II